MVLFQTRWSFVLPVAVKLITTLISKPGITFLKFFFPSSVIEWNKLNHDFCNSNSLNNFKFSKFVILLANTFDINNPYNIKLPTNLVLVLGYLCNYKCRRNFQNYINPTCDCGLEIETTAHFLIYFSLFIKITKIDKRFLEKHNK